MVVWRSGLIGPIVQPRVGRLHKHDSAHAQTQHPRMEVTIVLEIWAKRTIVTYRNVQVRNHSDVLKNILGNGEFFSLKFTVTRLHVQFSPDRTWYRIVSSGKMKSPCRKNFKNSCWKLSRKFIFLYWQGHHNSLNYFMFSRSINGLNIFPGQNKFRLFHQLIFWIFFHYRVETGRVTDEPCYVKY